MALGKKRLGAVDRDRGLGLEFVKCKRGFGVLISSRKSGDSKEICGESRELEALPQDILVRIICGVEHEDLKQLFDVSKTIREATLIAKKLHFEYTTPKKTLFFRGGLDSMTDMGDEIEAPFLNKYRLSRITCQNKFSNISIALFK